MTEAADSVPLTEVEAGAVLAEDVLNSTGQVLVSRDTVLTPKLCEMLQNRGVERVSVKPAAPAVDPEAVRQRLDHQFRRCAQNETMATLRAVLERFHCREDR